MRNGDTAGMLAAMSGSGNPRVQALAAMLAGAEDGALPPGIQVVTLNAEGDDGLSGPYL